MGTTVRISPAGLAEVQEAGDFAAYRLALAIADDAERYAPVETGALRATIRVDRGSPITRIWVGDVAGDVDYHTFQEFGTSRMTAQPYIRPAVYQRRSL